MTGIQSSPGRGDQTLLYEEILSPARIIRMTSQTGKNKHFKGASTGSQAKTFGPSPGSRFDEMDSKKEVSSTCYQ